MSELWVNFIECLLRDRHPAKHFIYKEEQGKLDYVKIRATSVCQQHHEQLKKGLGNCICNVMD